MAGDTITSTEYIKHHLQNLVYGQHPDGSWGFAHSVEAAKEMGPAWHAIVDCLSVSGKQTSILNELSADNKSGAIHLARVITCCGPRESITGSQHAHVGNRLRI